MFNFSESNQVSEVDRFMHPNNSVEKELKQLKEQSSMANKLTRPQSKGFPKAPALNLITRFSNPSTKRFFATKRSPNTSIILLRNQIKGAP